MTRRRRFSLRRPATDPATARGISDALHRTFDALDQSEDAKLQRLIEQMKAFEGTQK